MIFVAGMLTGGIIVTISAAATAWVIRGRIEDQWQSGRDDEGRWWKD